MDKLLGLILACLNGWESIFALNRTRIVPFPKEVQQSFDRQAFAMWFTRLWWRLWICMIINANHGGFEIFLELKTRRNGMGQWFDYFIWIWQRLMIESSWDFLSSCWSHLDFTTVGLISKKLCYKFNLHLTNIHFSSFVAI